MSEKIRDEAGKYKVKLTEELTALVCADILLGMTVIRACARANVSEWTWRRWRKHGQDAGEDEENIYTRFLMDVEQAEAQLQHNLLIQVNEAKAGTWQKYMTILERRFPTEFGRSEKRQVELSGPDGGPVPLLAVPLESGSIKEWEATIRDIAEGEDEKVKELSMDPVKEEEIREKFRVKVKAARDGGKLPCKCRNL